MLKIIPCVLIVIFILSIVSFADVKTNIDAHAEYMKSEQEKKAEQKKMLVETKDGVELGRQEFIKSCAVCHGDDAKGDGPLSNRLDKKPLDLTLIQMNNNGVFPFIALYKVIDGRENVSMHGSRTMPIWGDRLSGESWFEVSTKHAETLARGKIFEMLLYLESVQEN
jgi:mono/diheme cytochrome c family protein